MNPLFHILPFAIPLLALAFSASAAPTTQPDDVAARLRDHLAQHPRLLLDREGAKALATRAVRDPQLARVWQRTLDHADAALKLPPLEHKLTGRRLLSVSRDALDRIPTFALAYRMTSDHRYLDAARQCMLTIAGFDDLNPSHFLDVAEATAAMAIGYDWLYSDLATADRAAIRTAIVEKGLNASYTTPPQWWVNGTNNWNQVCNGGMTLGALAVAEDEPQLAARILSRAIESLPHVMKNYAPDGAYPEGMGYWGYGTTYNTLMIAALKSAVGDDFGLSQQPGFLKTSAYRVNLIGPTGLNFSYSDGSERSAMEPSATAYYLATLNNDPSQIFYEVKSLDRLTRSPKAGGGSDQFDWLLMIWAATPAKNIPPAATHYVAQGDMPVATHRSSWDDDATFIAIKGGSPGASHGHMDVGSFCLDANGVRWSSDLGAQDYNSLETRKIDLWNSKQGSQRWQVFRIGPLSHNILTVDGHEQTVKGHAPIVRSADAFTIVDTSGVYVDQLAAATRGIILRPDKSVRLQDEVRAPAQKPATVRWAMLTMADVKLNGATATLSRDKKQLQLKVISPANAKLKIVSTDPPHDYDVANPGSRLITFEVTLKAGESSTLAVDFTPGKGEASADEVVPLAKW